MNQERIKIRGRVVEKPSIVIGRGIGCKVKVGVLNNVSADYDFYDVIVTKGRKPWKLQKGDIVIAIGILKGNVLYSDYFKKVGNTLWTNHFRKYKPPGRSRFKW